MDYLLIINFVVWNKGITRDTCCNVEINIKIYFQQSQFHSVIIGCSKFSIIKNYLCIDI